MAYKRAEITMAFKLQVLDTADSPNIQQLGPDCMCAIIATANRAAYFLLEEQIPRDVGDSILSVDSAKMKRMQTSLTTFLAKNICQGKANYVY